MRQRFSFLLGLGLLVLIGIAIYLAGPFIFGSTVVQLPDEFRPLVEKYATDVGVDPCFLSAIVQGESRWNPGAKSYVGARGLGQLMPGTASSVARLYGVSYSPSQITDPAKNLQLAALLLRYNFDKYGSIRNVLVAYNAGGARVKLPDKSLPAETKRYLVSITTYYAVYRSNKDYSSFCKGSGTGLISGGSSPPHVDQSEDFNNFPEIRPPQSNNINPNDLWKTFLGI